MNRNADYAEAARAYDIYTPWLAVNRERMVCKVTLSSGTVLNLYVPLGAACELEEAGYAITVHGSL